MAINKKLITFDKKAAFLGANGINNASTPTDGYYHNIPEWSMVFILDTGEIWHNGKYFGKPVKDQIFPATNQTTKGLVFTTDGNSYYYRTFNLWGNTFDGSTRDINGELTVTGASYNWTFGDAAIRKGNTNLIAFSNDSNNYKVYIPGGDLMVTGGNVNVGNSKVILNSSGVIEGTNLLNTNAYFNLEYTLGKTWSSIKLFSPSGTTISLDTTRPAIINIQEHAHATNTLWQPWIAGGDITEQSSWGIGLGGDTFYIGRIAKSHTENSLSQYWKFSPTDGLCLSGTTKYIKVEGLTNASQHIFMADGTVKSLSDISSEALIGEATTSSYGGFKLTQDKASVQQNLVNNTTGNGRYAVKMNANGTLYVEFSQANTWLPATNAQEGYVPMLETSSDSIGSQLNEYVLTFEASEDETITPTWKRLPENAFSDTTYSTATNSALGLVKVGSTLDSTTGYTAVKIKDGVIYYHDTTYSFKTLAFLQLAGTDLMTYDTTAAKTILSGDNVTFTYANNVLTISATDTTYSAATNSVLGLIKVGTTLDTTTGYTAIHINNGVAYYHDTTYSFSNLAFKSDVNTTLMNYNSLAAKTVLAGTNITFTHSDNVLTISSTNTWNANTKDADGYVAAPKSGNNYLTNKVWKTDNNGNPGWRDDDNTWDAASTSKAGYVPKLATGGGTISTQASEYVLTYVSSGSGTVTPTWKLLPANAFKNDNTWTPWAGATENANGTAGYMPAPTSALRGQFLRGDGSWVSLNNYSLPTATDSALGGVKVGTTLTDTNGFTAVHIKEGVIYYKDTTYTFYNLVFNDSSSDVMTYKPATSPAKTVKSGSNISFSVSGNILTIAATNTWKAANTSQEGYVPKLALASTDTIATQASEYVLTYKSGTETTPVWRKLPSNAFSNDNTLYYLTLNGTVNGTANKTNLGTIYAPTSSGTGFLKCTASGTTITWSYDNTTYATPDATTTLVRAASNLTKDTWSDVGTFGDTVTAGTYVVNFTYDSIVYSGVFSYSASADTLAEEINLHAAGTGTKRLYARISGKKFLIVTADDTFSMAQTVFNFRKLI